MAGDVFTAWFQEGPGIAVLGRSDTSDPTVCSNGWLD
jgi:hypothetical protein